MAISLIGGLFGSSSVQDRAHLADSEKLVYLQQSLKGGSAKGVIEGLSRSGKCYAEAIKISTVHPVQFSHTWTHLDDLPLADPDFGCPAPRQRSEQCLMFLRSPLLMSLSTTSYWLVRPFTLP